MGLHVAGESRPYGFRIAAIEELVRVLVRPLVTVIFAVGITWFTAIGYIDGNVYAAAALSTISYWFASRKEDKAEQQIEAQQQELVAMARALPPDEKR